MEKIVVVVTRVDGSFDCILENKIMSRPEANVKISECRGEDAMNNEFYSYRIISLD